jgi:hypothetical protein
MKKVRSSLPSSDRSRGSLMVKKDSTWEEVPPTSEDYKIIFEKVVKDATNKRVDREVTTEYVREQFENLRILRRERVYSNTEEFAGYQFSYILGAESFRTVMDVARFVFKALV